MNVSFLNPAFLYALPLFMIPVLLHLFSIKKAKDLKFPEVKFIKLAVKKTLTRIRLWQFLLLLLRVLMIIVLVMIFARPVARLKNNSAGSREDPQGLCLILDNSYSMGAVYKNKSSFEKGKEACQKLLNSLRACDSVSFALMAEDISKKTEGFTPDLLETGKQIKNAALSFNTTSIAAGLNFGYSALKELPGDNKQIVIVSDLALHGFNSGLKNLKDYNRKVKVIFVDTGEAAQNIALGQISASASELDDNVKIAFTVENSSESKYLKIPVSLVMNGVRSAYGFIDSFPGRKNAKNLYFNTKGRDAGGYVELEVTDALLADNTAYVTAAGAGKSRVLLVDGDVKISQFQNETFFLKLALNPDPRFPGEVIPSVCVPAELEYKELSDYRAVFLCNVEKLSAVVSGRLKAYLSAGGNIVFFPGDRVDAEAYSGLDPEIFPAFINGFEDGAFSLDPENTGVNHPVFKPAFFAGLAGTVFSRHFNLAPKKGCFAVASFAKDGYPLMLEKKGAGGSQGKVVLFSFPADREWSDFPLRSCYLPFMQELAKYLCENIKKENTGSIFVGETFKKTFPPGDYPGKLELLVTGGGTAGYTLKDNVFLFKETKLPGIYTLKYLNKKGEHITESFAVNLNVPAGESDLKKQGLAGIKKALPENTGVFLIKDHNNVDREVTVLLRGRELTFPLMIVLLTLLTLEGVLALLRYLL